MSHGQRLGKIYAFKKCHGITVTILIIQGSFDVNETNKQTHTHTQAGILCFGEEERRGLVRYKTSYFPIRVSPPELCSSSTLPYPHLLQFSFLVLPFPFS